MEISQDQIREKIKTKLNKAVKSSNYLRNAILLVHSDLRNIHWKFSAGATGQDNRRINPDHPYHIASIGKTFTSMLVARLFERSKIDIEEPITSYISSDLLENLFVYEGTDHAKEVKVRHLLNHTSGIADYFEDKPLSGKSIKQLAVEDPQRFWKPDELIDYTRNKQKTYSVPGNKFHYSDTGYVLLGKIIENISGKPFHENLHKEIFDPLGMENSHFLFYSEPKEKKLDEKFDKIADFFLGDHEVSTYKSLSIDWAGGGIVSTTENLLLFQKALVNHTLIKKETWDLWTKDTGRFLYGMKYGYGIMFLNIGKMTIVLPKKLNVYGNMGSIGAYMFYNPAYDIHLIGTFNHSKYVAKQVFFVIELMRKLSRMGNLVEQ